MTSKTHLFFFPFAGASFYSYNPLINALPKELFDVTVLEVPGRGKRSGEPLLSDICAMADDLFGRIRDQLNSPYAFYGHSMGSVLAYETSLRVQDSGLEPPSHLFLSGRGGPRIPHKNPDLPYLTGDKFYEKLKEYGGTPDEVLQDKELMAFFEPVLRADFTAAVSYISRGYRKIDSPLTVLFGNMDITRDDARAWQEITQVPLTIREFEGNHFFIFDHILPVCDVICQTLSEKFDKK